jgi:CheY-like chemotaxis protein/HPt (histidine-containing phosphotransfer) domain-containing protein
MLKAQEKDLRLVFDTAPQIPSLLVGDALRLGQVLTNLVGNAIKFTKSGEVLVKTSLLKESERELTLEFLVRDTGIGMSEPQLAGLFQPFSQADSSISRKYGGTGLGLTISQRLVTMMGGKITVTSQPGQGSDFCFALNFERQPSTQPEALGFESEASGVSGSDALDQLRDRQALLVEDNAINQLVAFEMLQDLGMKLSVADSGEDAIQMVMNGTFDVVLMDIQMPGIDGYQATAQIRSDPRFCFEKLPIIAMTAHALIGDREKALEAGLNDHISKPVSVNELINTLLRWLTVKPLSNTNNLQNSEKETGLPAALEPTLNTRSALIRLGNNEQLYLRLLRLFPESQGATLDNLRTALQTNDLELARRLAHTLKGVAATIGADDLNLAAKHLENAIVQQDTALYEDYLDQAQKKMANVLVSIAAIS